MFVSRRTWRPALDQCFRTIIVVHPDKEQIRSATPVQQTSETAKGSATYLPFLLMTRRVMSTPPYHQSGQSSSLQNNLEFDLHHVAQHNAQQVEHQGYDEAGVMVAGLPSYQEPEPIDMSLVRISKLSSIRNVLMVKRTVIALIVSPRTMIYTLIMKTNTDTWTNLCIPRRLCVHLGHLDQTLPMAAEVRAAAGH